MAFIRLVVFGFLFLSVIYLCLAWYSRSLRREKLENEWDEEKPEGVSREDFVSKGVAEYNAGLRPKLLALVYVVPTIIVAVIIYVTNTN